MNFAEFQQTRAALLRERTGLLDLAETNLYRAAARFKPPSAPRTEATVHRCHLASEWTQCFGLDEVLARRALISGGVRDSLRLLFGYYATQRARLWLPADNYPVFHELAHAAGLLPRSFPTIPQPEWPAEAPASGQEVMLITNPLKPLGRWLTAEECAALTSWLTASPHRRLLIDAVYTFEARFHPHTLELLATGQVTLLHSLTKGWLHPQLFGIALVPEVDAAALTPVFRAHPPAQESLAQARHLMGNHRKLPLILRAELIEARAKLPPQLQFANATPGYLSVVQRPWPELLESEGVLGVPASAVGSARTDCTIISTLTLL